MGVDYYLVVVTIAFMIAAAYLAGSHRIFSSEIPISASMYVVYGSKKSSEFILTDNFYP
jgi:hypothetical protein